jgi:hypothetical protein
MSINLQTGSYTAPQVLPGASSTDIQVAQKQPEQYPELLPTPSEPSTPHDAEQQRYDQVLNASQNVAGNSYAVSDKSFTIFKNTDGQYVTRYTSLRDGKVTYVPEQTLVQIIGPGQAKAHQPILHIKA